MDLIDRRPSLPTPRRVNCKEVVFLSIIIAFLINIVLLASDWLWGGVLSKQRNWVSWGAIRGLQALVKRVSPK